MSHTEIKAPTTDTCQCGKPAHETRTSTNGTDYQVCFSCAQDWQAVLVRKEDVPQVAAVGRRLYKRAAEAAGYTVTDTTREDQAAEPALCHVYGSLCTVRDGEDGDQVDEHGRHYDHSSDTISVPDEDAPRDPKIWAYLLHLSDSIPCVGFMGADLTPAQARIKAQQLREFADELDVLADQVDRALALHRIREARAAADGKWAQILDIVLDEIEQGSDPEAVIDQVLSLMQRVRAENTAA